jgi:hypothetical protein
MSDPTMLDHALALSRATGYETFPLVGKVPAIAGGRGCLDASSDPQIIKRLWHGRPQANIGIHVPDDVLVLDIDPRHDGLTSLAALEATHGPLPATRTVLSGRGDGGSHRYFQHPGGAVTAARLGRGLDLKKRGGYLVAPPSRHPDTGKPYRWADTRDPVPLPDWLSVLLRPLPAPQSPPGWDKSVVDSSRRFEALVQFVMDSVEGQRNERLFWSVCRAAEMIHAGELSRPLAQRALQLAGEATGLGAAEVEDTVTSGLKPRARQAVA